MKFIVGLGNPGEEYENTRHNTGFMILNLLVPKKTDWNKASGTQALYYRGKIGKDSVEYLKPTTFMNNSGVAVKYAKDKHKLKLEDIVVIYDDVDLPFGKIKLSIGKSSGGHNGLESVIKKIKSKDFLRIRVGISKTTPSGKLKKPKGEDAVLKFLLGKFKEPEIKELKKVAKKIGEALEVYFKEGAGKAMSLYN